MAGRKKAVKAPETVTIKLVKSLAGRLQNQKACAEALGLKRVGDVKVQPNTAGNKG